MDTPLGTQPPEYLKPISELEPRDINQCINWLDQGANYEIPQKIAATANDPNLDDSAKVAKITELQERKKLFADRLAHKQQLMHTKPDYVGTPDFANMTDEQFRSYRKKIGVA